jgi:hypothetical protein
MYIGCGHVVSQESWHDKTSLRIAHEVYSSTELESHNLMLQIMIWNTVTYISD